MGTGSRSDDIHELRFRESALNETHTRYDNIVAGGSDRERFVQWTVYASIALTAALVALLVLVAILRKPAVRRQSFNLFLVFLIIPDLVFSFFCGVNCALNAAHGDYVSAGWCRFQVFYCVWGIGCNAWLNAAIARHLHRMLRCGARMERYFPPTRKQVIYESLGVYLWMAFVASWVFVPFLPHEIALSAGLACLPHEYDAASTIFLWVVFMPAFALLPTTYAMYVSVDVWYNKLLPPTGKRRDLAVYFARIVAVFLLMWVPSIFLMFIAGGYTSSWVAFIGGCWSHTQGAVSAIASVVKKDIWNSFWEMMTCGRHSPANGWRVSFYSRSSRQMTPGNNPPSSRLCTIEEDAASNELVDVELDDKQEQPSTVLAAAHPEETAHEVESDAMTP